MLGFRGGLVAISLAWTRLFDTSTIEPILLDLGCADLITSSKSLSYSLSVSTQMAAIEPDDDEGGHGSNCVHCGVSNGKDGSVDGSNLVPSGRRSEVGKVEVVVSYEEMRLGVS